MGVRRMKSGRREYLSYLLRIWRTGSEEEAVWLASLTNPFTGEQLGFASLKELLAFLESQLDDGEGHVSEEDRHSET